MEEPSYTNTNVQCRMCGTVTPSKGAPASPASSASPRPLATTRLC